MQVFTLISRTRVSISSGVSEGSGCDQVLRIVGTGRGIPFVSEDNGAAARIADGDIDAAHIICDFTYRRLGCFAIRQVRLKIDCLHAKRFAFRHDAVRRQQRFLEFVDIGRFQIAVDDRDIRTECGQAKGIPATQAAGTAGHQGNFSLQFPLTHCRSSI